MFTQDELSIIDRGEGHLVGELKTQSHELKYLKSNALVCQFEGVDSMLDYMSSSMKEAKREKASSRTGRKGFNAFDSYEEAMRTFRKTPDKIVQFDASELRIKDESEAGSQVEYDVTGSFIDMGRFMEGIPEVMGEMHNGNARNRRVSLMVDISQAAFVNHKDITHRSERILRLVDALEAGGIRTRLVAIESNECSHAEIVLKHHEETLNIADLAVVTHPEFLRRIIFRVNEHSKTWDSGYGSSIDFNRAVSSNPSLIESDNVNEMTVLVDGNMTGRLAIDDMFDKLERLLTWEMSKPVPEVSAVRIGERSISFNPNGARSDDEIRREGMEAINAEG